MNGATVSVVVVTNRIEAELIVGLLRSHGLRAAVAADDAGQEPQLQLQGVRVLVAPSGEASAVASWPPRTLRDRSAGARSGLPSAEARQVW